MTNAQIKEIRERCEVATPGPWVEDGYGDMIRSDNPYGCGSMRVADIRGWGHLTGKGACAMEDGPAMAIQHANAQFIASARQDVPALLHELERLRADNEALRNGGHFDALEMAKIAGVGTENERLRMELEAVKRERDAVNNRTSDALQVLDAVNEQGEIQYSDYTEMYDAINAIYPCPVTENTPAQEMGAPGNEPLGGGENG
ncbi:MAG: hypothetical protein WC047_00170 [Kiritimatiellales bacterium]